MGLRIKLLGQFEIYRDGRSITQTEWRTEKNKDLLKILALYPGQILSQDWLLEALWPDQDPERSVRNLRGRISEIRRILEPQLSQGSESNYVRTIASGYALEPHWCRIDTAIFQDCYRQAVTQADLDADEAIRAFRRALEIYRGDLLPSDLHKDWTFERREELRRLYLDALRQLTALLYRAQHYPEATRYGEQALQADPFDEHIYRTLMRSHHEMGNAHAALKLYERCRRALAGSNMAPSEATEHLFETVRHQAYRFSEQVSMEDSLETIAVRLDADPDPDERWELLGQQIEHLHDLGRRSEEAAALERAEAFARETADPGKLGRVFLKWADHHRALGDLETSEHYAQQAHERFAAIDDPLGMAEAECALGRCFSARNDVNATSEHYERALASVRSADGLRAEQLRMRVWRHLGQLAVRTGRHAEAQAYYDQALRLSQAIEDYAEQARLFLRLGSLHYYRDLTAQAGVHWEHGRELARRIGHQEIEVKCLLNLAALKTGQLDLTSAWGLYETVLDVQERLRDTDGLAKSWNNIGTIHDALGRPQQALEAFQTSQGYSESTGDDLGVAIEAMNVASVQIYQARFAEAASNLHEALDVFQAHGSIWYEIQALYYRGELELARGQPRESEDWFDRALHLAEQTESRKLSEHVRAALAVVTLETDRRKDALEWAEVVEASLVETPPGLDDPRVRYRLYRVFCEAGRDQAADRHLRKAHDQVVQLREHLTDSTDREAFERVPLYRAIFDAFRQRLE